MNKKTLRTLTSAALIAALYVVITMAFLPLSFGQIQVRVSESLTILPVFSVAAVPGLFIGCLIANILGGAMVIDVVLGSIATLIGAIGTYFLRKKNIIWAPLPTILANGIIIPLVLQWGYQVPVPYWMLALFIIGGELISAGVLGILLAKAIKPFANRIFPD